MFLFCFLFLFSFVLLIIADMAFSDNIGQMIGFGRYILSRIERQAFSVQLQQGTQSSSIIFFYFRFIFLFRFLYSPFSEIVLYPICSKVLVSSQFSSKALVAEKHTSTRLLFAKNRIPCFGRRRDYVFPFMETHLQIRSSIQSLAQLHLHGAHCSFRLYLIFLL